MLVVTISTFSTLRNVELNVRKLCDVSDKAPYVLPAFKLMSSLLFMGWEPCLSSIKRLHVFIAMINSVNSRTRVYMRTCSFIKWT